MPDSGPRPTGAPASEDPSENPSEDFGAASSGPSRIPTRPVKRWVLLLSLSLLAAAVALPPLININRYHRRIAESIGEALGRPVHMSSVKLVLLPRPGFEVSDFVVEEDRSFGAEPILSSSSVTASIRIVSLWRGRLEIARIHLEEPSLNLVRSASGQWNFARLLVQAAHSPTAPTAQLHAGPALRFPYIEASNARINFKFGDEKRPFSFLNADLGMWLNNPDQWRLRFEAQPARTDLVLNLADTGLFRVEGSVQKAATLGAMPIALQADWSNAPAGQLSRILSGSDQGWRGTLDVHAAITGSPDAARIDARVEGSGIHRQEFEPDQDIDFDAHCEMLYLHTAQSIEGLTCLAPIGTGQLVLAGSVLDISKRPTPNLSLDVQRVPVAALLQAGQMMHRGLAPNLHASGELEGRFAYGPGGDPDAGGWAGHNFQGRTRGSSAKSERQSHRRSSHPSRSTSLEFCPALQGQAVVKTLTLTADGLKKPLRLENVTLAAQLPEDMSHGGRRLSSQRSVRTHATHSQAEKSGDPPSVGKIMSGGEANDGPSLQLMPVPIGGPQEPTLTISGRFSTTGFGLHLAGTASLERLTTLGRDIDLIPAPLGSLGPQGTADVDLSLGGPWLPPATAELSNGPENSTGVSAPTAVPGEAEGTVTLHNARFTTNFLNGPIDVVSARGSFSGGHVAWNGLSVDYGPLHADGSFDVPVRCGPPQRCTRHFNLHFNEIDAGALQSRLLGARRGQLVEELLSQLDGSPRPWPAMEGDLRIGTLSLATLVLRDATASVHTEGNLLSIDSLDARSLGGALHVSGSVNTGGGPPVYALHCGLKNADPDQAAALFNESWGEEEPARSGAYKAASGLADTGAATRGGFARLEPAHDASTGRAGRSYSKRRSRGKAATNGTGTLTLDARLQLGGYTVQQLASSARGAFRWDWAGGALGSDGKSPFSHFDRWVAEGTVHDQSFYLDRSFLTLRAAKMVNSPSGRRPVIAGPASSPGSGSAAQALDSQASESRTSEFRTLGSANSAPDSETGAGGGLHAAPTKSKSGRAEPASPEGNQSMEGAGGDSVGAAPVLMVTGSISFARELSLHAAPATLSGPGLLIDPDPEVEADEDAAAGTGAAASADAAPVPAATADPGVNGPSGPRADASFDIGGSLHQPVVTGAPHPPVMVKTPARGWKR